MTTTAPTPWIVEAPSAPGAPETSDRGANCRKAVGTVLRRTWYVVLGLVTAGSLGLVGIVAYVVITHHSDPPAGYGG